MGERLKTGLKDHSLELACMSEMATLMLINGAQRGSYLKGKLKDISGKTT